MPRKSKEMHADKRMKQAAKHLERAAKHGEKERQCTMKAHDIMSGCDTKNKRGRKSKYS